MCFLANTCFAAQVTHCAKTTHDETVLKFIPKEAKKEKKRSQGCFYGILGLPKPSCFFSVNKKQRRAKDTEICKLNSNTPHISTRC